MGQQQLLLLVLGIVIVGLAVVVGIQAFNENQTKSRIDQFTTQGVAVTGDIIAWYQKPTAQGGAGGVAANLATITAQKLGYEQNYSGGWPGGDITGVDKNNQRVAVGANVTHPFALVHVNPYAAGDVMVEVHAFGPGPGCIVSRSILIDVNPNWSDGKGFSEAPDNPDPTTCSW